MEELSIADADDRIIREIRCGRYLTENDAKQELMWEKINDIVGWIKEYEETDRIMREQKAILGCMG